MDVLTNVILTAIEDSLITTAALTDINKRLNNPQTKLFPLLRLVHHDILDVPRASEPAQELALDEYATYRDDAVCGFVDDDKSVICPWRGSHGVELRHVSSLAWIGDNRQYGKHGEVSAGIVGGRQRAYLFVRTWSELAVQHLKNALDVTWSSAGNSAFTSGLMRAGEKRRSREVSGVKEGIVVGHHCVSNVQVKK
jgi:hypothetical protein